MVNFHAFKIFIYTSSKRRETKQKTKKSHNIAIKRMN